MKYSATIPQRRLWGCICSLIVPSLLAPCVHAATERYDYDSQGRLVRRVDSQNQSTDYSYDAAGNIIQVQGGNVAQAPAVTGITPSAVRRNQAVQASATGAGLTNITVRGSDPGVQVSSVVSSAAAVSFRLSVSGSVPLGVQQLVFENAAGSATASFEVVPAATYRLVPQPVALPPDNVARQFTLVASEAATVATQFTVTSLAPAIAKTTSPSVTIPANGTEAVIKLAGVSNGNAVVSISSPLLAAPLEVLVTVKSDLAGGLPVYGRPLGIVKGSPVTANAASVTRQVSRPIGIAKGSPVTVNAASVTRQVSRPVGILK